jgi:hypothetical protein
MRIVPCWQAIWPPVDPLLAEVLAGGGIPQIHYERAQGHRKLKTERPDRDRTARFA